MLLKFVFTLFVHKSYLVIFVACRILEQCQTLCVQPPVMSSSLKENNGSEYEKKGIFKVCNERFRSVLFVKSTTFQMSIHQSIGLQNFQHH